MEKKSPNSILLVSPTDQIIGDLDVFFNCVRDGLDLIKNGQLVTFGVKPNRLETAYGYLEVLNENTIFFYLY